MVTMAMTSPPSPPPRREERGRERAAVHRVRAGERPHVQRQGLLLPAGHRGRPVHQHLQQRQGSK